MLTSSGFMFLSYKKYMFCMIRIWLPDTEIMVMVQLITVVIPLTAPTIPTKEGYDKTAPTWDKDGKNITADTEINAVYIENPKTDSSGSPQTGDDSNLCLCKNS